MARIRTLKPEFFRSRSLARVSPIVRLTFQGLWCEADDFGRGVADARILKGAIWPLDDDLDWKAVEKHLLELAETGHIVLYEVAGERYFFIPSWEEHQAAAYRRGKAVHPEPPAEQESHDETCKEMHDAPPDVLELGTGNEELGSSDGKRPSKPERDALFDALVDTFGTATTPQRQKHYGKTVTTLLGLAATPDEVRRRGKNLTARGWDNPSPEALLKWWDTLDAGAKASSEPELVRDNNGRRERFMLGTGWVAEG